MRRLALLPLLFVLAACGGENESPSVTAADTEASPFADLPPSPPEEFCDLVSFSRYEPSVANYDSWMNDICLPLMTTGLGSELTGVEQNMVASCLIDTDYLELDGCIDHVIVQRYADDLPDCSKTWSGEFLPEDYKGCVYSDGTLEPARAGDCANDRKYFVFFDDDDKTYIAFDKDGWLIHDADAEGHGSLCGVRSPG